MATRPRQSQDLDRGGWAFKFERGPEGDKFRLVEVMASDALRGVFSTRSADRPNPIGLHEVEVLEIDGDRVRVSGIEAVDGTQIVDVKPVIS